MVKIRGLLLKLKRSKGKLLISVLSAVVILTAAVLLILYFSSRKTTDTLNKEGGDSMVTNENSKNKESRDGIEAMANPANLTDMSSYRDPASEGSFKLIGYLFNISEEAIDQMKWDKLTHINYAFAIPTTMGTLRSLDNKALVKNLVTTAHENNVKVAISVGGWSYNNVELEGTFVEATDTDDKCRTLSENILKLVDDYGFDGVDMDWEYPKKGISEHQYEYFMTFLRQGLTNRGKYLTAAVVGCGSTGEGQTQYILDMLDWINVMAYDGDSGAGHSPYSHAVDCGKYWLNTRGVDKSRVVLGVPFYARPSWETYADIIAKDESAAYKDMIEEDGTSVYYNGLTTMVDKTKWACENASGIMIWEITQDTKNEKLSLLNQIDKTIQEYYPDYKKSK